MHTGDGAYMDEEGFLFIVDRIKDMIITGGENVYSAEVENAVMKHPSVAMCAVVGTPDERYGELVTAVCVLKTGVDSELKLEDLRSFCKELIAGYKCPRRVEVWEKLPVSGAGKILKHEIRKKFWAGHEQEKIYGTQGETKKSAYQ